MTIFLSTADLLDLESYDGLQRAILRWTDRDDLSDSAPAFIALAEARLRRILTMPEMETEVVLDTGASVSLPDDFDSARLLFRPGTHRRVIRQVSPAEFYDLHDHAPGHPRVYATIAGKILLHPTPDAEYPATLVYRATIPSLGPDKASNWLLAKHPDIYLYASLVQAEFYGWNDERLALIKGALDEAITEANDSGNRKRYSGAPLVARPVSREGVWGAYRR